MDLKNFGVYQDSQTNYVYYEEYEEEKDDVEYNISIQNYIFEDENGLPDIVTNYFINDPLFDKSCYFASIFWNKINYI